MIHNIHTARKGFTPTPQHRLVWGFTLIEVLITVTLLGVLIGVGTLNLANYKNRHSFDLDVTNVIEALRSAQNKAILGDQGTAWGVKLTSDANGGYFELFSGSAYATSSVLLRQSLSGASEFSNPQLGSSQTVLFTKTSGIPDTAHTIVLRGGTGSSVVSISVSASGNIKRITDSNLVGYWTFNEGSGTTAYDTSGGGNNGTLVNSPAWQSGSNCKAGGCLSFNGNNTLVQISSAIPSGTKTLTGWIKLNTTTYNKAFFGNYVAQVNSGYLAHYNGTQYLDSSSTVSAGNWYHLAYVFDQSSNTLTFYINGVESGVRSSPNFSYTTPYIGIYSPGTGSSYFPFDGIIDEVRVYNRALSATEIKNLYESY